MLFQMNCVVQGENSQILGNLAAVNDIYSYISLIIWKLSDISPLLYRLASDDLEVVLCTGIAAGTTKDWEYMWRRYLKETFKGEKNILLRSLTCTREIKLLER